MKHKNINMYDKFFYEAYAKLILKKLCDLYLINSDKPDLKNEDLNIGIEVTRAISQTDGQEQVIINNYFGKGYEAQYIKDEITRNYPKENGIKEKIKVIDKFAFYVKDNSELSKIELIKQCINQKDEKLGNQIKMYKTNYLYIFIDTGVIWDESIYEVMKYRKDTNVKFDSIYINGFNILFILNLKEEKICTIIISDKIQSDTIKEAIDEATILREN